MSIDRAVILLAGIMVLLTTTLQVVYGWYWVWFTMFIGLNMVQSSFTGFCPPTYLFKKLGMKTEVELSQLNASQ